MTTSGLRTAALALASLLLLAPGPPEAADPQVRQETRAIMERLLENLRALLPLAHHLDEPEVQKRAREVSGELAENASSLAGHATSIGGGAEFVGRSLARDTREIHVNLVRGENERAEYLIEHVTQNCVTCHARLPSEDSPLAEHFVSDDTLDGLPPLERATLQLATRRFDAGLASLEAILLEPANSPVLLMEPLTDYLTVSLRVLGDFERPVPTLQTFARRPDVWSQLRREVNQWVSALPSLGKRSLGVPSLSVAKAIIDEGQQLQQVPGDRSGLAHDVTASGILNRLVDGRTKGVDVAEAYYLLGLTEIRIGRNFYVTPADDLLEEAIRLAPGEPFARQAYDVLERQALLDYEGTSFESLPPEDAARLLELRTLIDSSS